jgi:hypothetical protein
MMKKIILVCLIFSVGLIYAQNEKKLTFGFTLGYNYSSNGDLNVTGGLSGIADKFSSDKKSGYHAGLYFKYKFNSVYLRPEVLYTNTVSDYDSQDFVQQKIDIPILLGFKIIGPLSFFAGPSFQYILDSDLRDLDINDINVENDISINAQLGLALQLGQIRVDVRYEKGISDNITTLRNTSISDSFTYNLNAKPEQLTLSLSLRL